MLVVLDGVQDLSRREMSVRCSFPLELQWSGLSHRVARVGHEGREQDGVHAHDKQQERACDEADAEEQQSAIAQRLRLCRGGGLLLVWLPTSASRIA